VYGGKNYDFPAEIDSFRQNLLCSGTCRYFPAFFDSFLKKMRWLALNIKNIHVPTVNYPKETDRRVVF
jgi:hypothetical protein